MSRILDALKQIDSSSASKPRAAKPLTPVDLDEIARRRPLSDTSSLGPTAAAVGLIPDLDKLESAVSGGDADLASDGDVDVPEIAIECDAVADAETDEVAETESLANESDDLALASEVPATTADTESGDDAPSAAGPPAGKESNDSLIESLMALDVINDAAGPEQPLVDEPERTFEAGPERLVGTDDVADPLFAIDETPAAPADGDDPLEQLLGSDDTPAPFVGSGEVLDPVFGTDIESAVDVEAFAPATQSLPLPPSLLVSRFDEPVQAARPEGPPPEAKPDLFGDDQRLAGAYSDLLDNLDTILPGQLPVRLSIGSAQARAGTHTIVVQLGHSLVQRHGQDVLLIDGDFASRSLSIGTGAGTNRGLLDVLSGSNALHEVTVACGADQLHLLPTGQGSHDDIDCPREAISALFEDVKQHFAFAVIDVGSAVHAVSSGLLQQSDAALLLLQLGTTPTHLAASTVASWQRQGTRLIGSVLCDLSL